MSRVLEVGGGESPVYHPNMDIRAVENVDVVHDMLKIPWPFEAESFYEVYMSHVLEHVGHKYVVKVLEEARRVLVVDGMITVKVPDIHRLSEGPKWYMKIQYIFADQVDDLAWRFHKCGFWKEGLEEVLESAGFCDVRVEESLYPGGWPELTGVGWGLSKWR